MDTNHLTITLNPPCKGFSQPAVKARYNCDQDYPFQRSDFHQVAAAFFGGEQKKYDIPQKIRSFSQCYRSNQKNNYT